MMVNAAQFPGPAMWQGVMLLLLPMIIFGSQWKEGKYFIPILWAYAAIGVLLIPAIVFWGR